MGFALELPALGVLLVATVAYLLLWGYKFTLGQLVELLIAVLRKLAIPVPGIGDVNLAAPGIALLEALNHSMYYAMGKVGEANKWAFAHFVSWNAYAWQEVSGAVGDVAEETWRTLDHYKRSLIPLAIAAATNPLGLVLYPLAKRVAELAKDVANMATHPTKAVVKVEHSVTYIASQAARAASVTVPHAIDVAGDASLPRIRALEHGASYIRGQLRRLSAILTPAGIIGLVGAVTFGSFGLGWLRCRGVNRIGRGLCGLSGLIEAAALVPLEAFAIADICRFASGMRHAATAVRPLLEDAAKAQRSLIHCGSYQPPAPIALPGLSPTPVVDAVAL